MRRLKPGDLVLIEFDDHTHNLKSIMPCVAMGRIHLIDETQVVIDSWYDSDSKERVLGDTTECFAIIRSTIHKMTRLVEDE